MSKIGLGLAKSRTKATITIRLARPTPRLNAKEQGLNGDLSPVLLTDVLVFAN